MVTERGQMRIDVLGNSCKQEPQVDVAVVSASVSF